MEKTKIGILGCGNISQAYVKGCRLFEILDVVACADLDMSKAKALAEQFGLQAQTVSDLLANPEIDIVINLTIPAVHAQVSLEIISAGKHVHSEKPLATNRADGQKVIAAAKAKGVRVGCAPDTFLGGGLQTCRKLIDDGAIGVPVGATAFMMGRGPEAWHPNPDFFYQPGAGPLFDMGPYYLTTLIHLLGPIERVASANRISFPERTVGSGPLKGQKITVNTPTFVAGVMNHRAGPVSTMITSFDVWKTDLPRLEIYGSEGSLQVPDPNIFGGKVLLRRAGAEVIWEDIPLTHSDKVLRGIGVADLAYAIQSGRPQRASGEMAYHVLDVMTALLESSEAGEHINVESTCSRPAPLPIGLVEGRLEL